MAVTISLYNHTAKLLLNKEVTLTTLKVELLNASASFTAANTTKSAVDNSGAYEVSGNGWASGGQTIGSVAVTTVTTNDAMLDGDDVDVAASGGDIGPATAALIYDSTSSKPLAYIDFGGSKTANNGTHFIIVWSANGIFPLTY